MRYARRVGNQRSAATILERTIFLASFVAILFLSNEAGAEVSPETFLSDILEHDFQADGAYRIGKGIWTAPAKAGGSDCNCSDHPEMFTAWNSPVVIVSSWKLVGLEKKPSKDIVLSAQFRVLATTTGGWRFWRE